MLRFCQAVTLALSVLSVAHASPGLFSVEESSSTETIEDITEPTGSSRLSDIDIIRGVNLGGVFLIEPFIRPSLFDQFNSSIPSDMPVDEWTFTEKLGKEEALRQLEDHWDTFVTKEHLETLAESGINWIRIPIGYWAFNLTDDEPFVNGQVPYIERILGWAQETGLKVELDLHGAPGSQNGYDNSGHRVTPEWLHSRTNVDRTLDAVRKMTQLAVDWEDAVYGIQILNEPSRWKWPVSDILEFYNEAYDIVRSMTNDVYFVIHDTFLGPNEWSTLVSSNWTNALMDTHIYQMFDNYIITLNETAHIDMVATMAENVTRFDRSSIGVVVGEFSAATHDCTKYINGLGRGSRWEGTLEYVDHPLCPFENCTCTGDYGSDYTEFSDHYKRFLRRYIDSQLSIYDRELAGWFYWNFRTESAPEWDYMLGVEQGWIPKFSRTAIPMTSDEESEISATDLVSSASLLPKFTPYVIFTSVLAFALVLF
ncbi:glucan exo-1,3-beta-glucosidase [Coemansia sp. RSA 1287]|nr:glucan exo-1,3-beta-glucosidase [Coemansia sp. RSA 454]KAJ2650253.1 glucan exo-1,3-beta-glucosidase [Coemansia sp. RSA 1287]